MKTRLWPISHAWSSFRASVLISATLLFSLQLALAQFTQQGPKLVGAGAFGNAAAARGHVALSADGNTAVVGARTDNLATGASWVFTRSGGVWTRQGTAAKRQANVDVAEAETKRMAAEAEAKRIAEAARDPALSVTPGSGKAFKDQLADSNPCPMCPEMVVVPAGKFLMGSTPSEIAALTKEFPHDADWWKTEEPQHEVTIAQPFAVGRYAVTFAEWDACVADSGCNGYQPRDEGWGRGKLPVINVNWDDAKAYAAWLSRKTGKTYRLLSEAERDYVTRAGTTTAYWSGSSISTSQANYDGNYTFAGGAKGEYREKTVPVDSFAAQSLGPLSTCMATSGSGSGIAGTIPIRVLPSDGSAWTTACTDR